MLFSCSSGGGGGGSGGTSITYVAADFETTEYDAQYGLASINASTAYADGNSGSGVTVAVIDTGVDTDHPDLVNNMASGGYDYVSYDSDPHPSGQGDYMSHGTHVAGIIAGTKNDSGIHGVAYNAKILAIRAGNSAGSLWSSKIRSAIDRAIDQGAKVINASFGGSSIYTSTANKWLSAHNNDIVSVHAAGNDGEDNPSYGAKLPIVSGYEDLADTQIAVVAVDSDNEIASWSNKCGNSKNWCLAAPGVSIYSTVDTTDNTDSNSDGYDTYNGTSMAAPHVAGAVALLRSKWPSKTASQITTILYDTATDLGDSGIDVVYGRGLLNLGSAISPAGLLQIAAINGSLHEVSSNTIYLSSSFGSSLNQEFDIAVLDKYRRDYYISSDNLVTFYTKPFEDDFNKFFYEKEEYSTSDSYFGKLTFNKINKPNFNKSSLKLEHNLNDLNITIAYNYSPEFIITPFNNGKFKGSERAIHDNPFFSMINNAFSMNIKKKIYNTDVSLGFLQGNLNKNNDQNIRGASIGFYTSPFSKLSLASQYNVFHEKKTFLAAKLSGAMKTNSSITNALNFNAKLNLIDDYNLVANYTVSTTSVNTSENSLIYSLSDIKSNGYSIALLSKNTFYKNDEYTLSYGQPLRVNNGYIFLNIPSGLNLDDTLSFRKQSINLNPSGKEINVKSSYSFDLNKNTELTSIIIYTRENNNNNSMEPIWETFIKLKSNF